MKPNIEGFRLDEDRWVYVLAQGRLVNLASGDGHPAEIMDMSFAIQALSARYIAQEHERLEKKLYAVPKEIDERVARQKLASMGVRIDELTSIQAEYLQSWRV